MRLSWVLTALVLLTASAASAQVAPGGQEAEAREHFEIARRYYELGQFRQAAAEFEAAYRISPRPQLLMNIYLSYRDAADPVNAARALREYLASDHPSAADRPGLETRLRALDRQVAEQAAATPDQPAPTETTEPTATTETPVPATASRTPDVVAPAIVLTAGGALLLAGVGTGAATAAEHGSLEAACPDRTCAPADAGRIDTVRGLGIATDVLLGVGLATAAAGLVWLIVELDSGGSDVETARLHCGGLGCSVRGTF